jgi:hypothetical protein
MKWSRFLIVLVCAMLAFGGTFNCSCSNDDGVIIVSRPS